MKFVGWLLLIVMLASVGLFGWMHGAARADPIVRTMRIGMRDWRAGAPPVRLLLASDIHLGNESMDPARLRRIVGQIDALHPDLIVLAGDYVAGHEDPVARKAAADMIGPLSGLHASLGVVAVMGNHDDSTEPALIAAALRQAGIRVLNNRAVRAGPLAIAGIGDLYTGPHDEDGTVAQARRLGGIPVAVTHGDDRGYLRGRIQLLLVGHTHCDQINLRRFGYRNPLMPPAHDCGVQHDHNGVTITTAGLGTSILPLRLFALPDLWVITLGPPAH